MLYDGGLGIVCNGRVCGYTEPVCVHRMEPWSFGLEEFTERDLTSEHSLAERDRENHGERARFSIFT